MKNERIKVMFIINRLGVGGAEQQLLELVRGIDKDRFEPLVISLYPGGALAPEIRATPGVELMCLGRRSKYDFSILYYVSRILRYWQIQIIQPFLTPASFFGILPCLTNQNIIKIITERCGVRANPNLGSSLYRSAEDFFSRFADWIIPNSKSGEEYVIKRGINPGKVKVIYNGINLQRLVPDLGEVIKIRQQLKLPNGGKIVGITASLTPAKDHVTFLRAVRLVSQMMPETRFAILGDGPLRPELEAMAKELGIENVVTFFGSRRNIGSYISAYDIACLTSFDHEGCSNATLEAMALGKPVAVTNIGGNKEVVQHDKTGLLVPPKDPDALADAIINYLQHPAWAKEIGQRARQKVHSQFSVERMVLDYQDLYENALTQKRHQRKRDSISSLP